MRLHRLSLVLLAVAFMLLPSVGVSAMFVLMVALVPMLVCGFALMHGIVAKKQMSVQWLIAMYALALVLMPTSLLLLALLALIDSVVDFRGRLKPIA